MPAAVLYIYIGPAVGVAVIILTGIVQSFAAHNYSIAQGLPGYVVASAPAVVELIPCHRLDVHLQGIGLVLEVGVGCRFDLGVG